jgi:hypothetical protein
MKGSGQCCHQDLNGCLRRRRRSFIVSKLPLLLVIDYPVGTS